MKRKFESDFAGDKIFEIESEEQLTTEDSDIIFDELVYKVGWIMIIFNSLDSLVEYYVDKSLDPDGRRSEINHLLILEMSYYQKVTFILRYYTMLVNNDQRFSSLQPTLTQLEQRLKESGTIRNRYAHAHFGTMIKGQFVKVKNKVKRGSVVFEYMRFQSYDLDEDIEFISETRDYLENFDDTFWRLVNQI